MTNKSPGYRVLHISLSIILGSVCVLMGVVIFFFYFGILRDANGRVPQVADLIMSLVYCLISVIYFRFSRVSCVADIGILVLVVLSMLSDEFSKTGFARVVQLFTLVMVLSHGATTIIRWRCLKWI